MSDLVVLAFKDQGGAGRFSAEIQRMQKMQILKLEDAAIVTRDAGGKAKVKQANSLVGAGAFGTKDGRVLLLRRERARQLAPEPTEIPNHTGMHDAIVSLTSCCVGQMSLR